VISIFAFPFRYERIYSRILIEMAQNTRGQILADYNLPDYNLPMVDAPPESARNGQNRAGSWRKSC